MSVAGKHALVTGGARGIGFGIAALLARNGARVSVVSRSVPEGSAGEEARFTSAQADVADEAAVRAAFARCCQVNGPVDILVNNAGIAESAPLKRTDRAMWDRIIATNLTGTFLCSREAVPGMVAAGWGRIVNIASTAGLAGAAYVAAYCASKHGVVGFTRAIAAELASTGVTANAICPGYTETEMMARSVRNITMLTNRSEEEARRLMARASPGGRIAAVDEVACGVLELINGDATGLAVVIPGGYAVPAPSFES
jgi:NAD(P)-dependent dehydrogenase (short-subunit alcohol dehydrogenase family)